VIRLRSHCGFYWRDLATQGDPGTTASQPRKRSGLPQAVAPWSSVLAMWNKIREVRSAPAFRASLIYFGLWLSLVERLVRDQEAVGSNPTSPIFIV
jgi:hypothetical protein